jgi:hypothetical protein
MDSGFWVRNGAIVSYRVKSLICLLALCVVGLPFAHGSELPVTSRKKPIKVRLIASEPSTAQTSFDPNWKSYVGEVQSNDGHGQLVRFVYRYSISAPALPGSFMDYTLVHQFNAVRDEGCDVPLASMIYSYRFSPGDDGAARLMGRELTLEYAKSAPALTVQGEEVLPCYVVGPKDYKRSRTSKPAAEFSRKSAEGY